MYIFETNNFNLFKLIYNKKLYNNIFLTNTQKIRYYNKLIKINNIFKYYEYLLIDNNNLLINLYYQTKVVCNIIIRFKNLLKMRKSIVFNNEDLLCNHILEDDNSIFNIHINKFIYKFTYSDFVNIINNSLLNYTKIENSDYMDNIIINPCYIKNPYTNLNFDLNVLYNFYIFCINNNKKIPIIFKLFYNQHFNLKNFFTMHETYIINNAYKGYIKNCESSTKQIILLSLITTFINFINKYIKNFSIKYLLTNYKLKFYNLTSDEINYYDSYLRDYMMLIYYYKTRQFKNFVDIKLKFIFNLLYDNNIKVLDPLLNNLFLNKNNEDYIIDFIIKNLKTIISNEMYILETNTLVLRFDNYETNNDTTNNDTTNNDTTNNDETSETNNDETSETNNDETSETSETNNDETSETNNDETNNDETSEINNSDLYETDELYQTNIFNVNNVNLNNKYKLFFKNLLLLKEYDYNLLFTNYNLMLFKILLLNIQIYFNLLMVTNIYKKIIIILV
tara:strand:+ start:170 stop:1690 length:1521 start_codon:yes stop_codon:yes gene_type:complete